MNGEQYIKHYCVKLPIYYLTSGFVGIGRNAGRLSVPLPKFCEKLQSRTHTSLKMRRLHQRYVRHLMWIIMSI